MGDGLHQLEHRLPAEAGASGPVLVRKRPVLNVTHPGLSTVQTPGGLCALRWALCPLHSACSPWHGGVEGAAGCVGGVGAGRGQHPRLHFRFLWERSKDFPTVHRVLPSQDATYKPAVPVW